MLSKQGIDSTDTLTKRYSPAHVILSCKLCGQQVSESQTFNFCIIHYFDNISDRILCEAINLWNETIF